VCLVRHRRAHQVGCRSRWTPRNAQLTRNAFRNLDPSVGDNPVAAMVHRMPDVRAARMHMARAAKRLRERPQDQARFIAYDDAWTAYCVVCEERYFNLGFDHGTRTGVGMAMGNIAANAAVMRSIARAVHAAVLAPGAPRQVIAAGLIELAATLMLPAPAHRERRQQQSTRPPGAPGHDHARKEDANERR